ncbi:MAG: SIR2 family protein [Methylocella sp.]
MAHILITGAGFSHNWGGWLAAEAFEYLLGAAEIDEYLRYELWQTKTRGGGFEDTLDTVQGAYQTNRSPENKRRLDAMTAALIGMFNAMCKAFARQRLEQDPNDALRVKSFLSGFDAIFTLNQDTLLEGHYLGNVRWSEKWPGAYLPYMERMNPEPQTYYPYPLDAPMTPAKHFTALPDLQPYYKLHGSYNWFSVSERLLVMGGNKAGDINASAVLAQYHREFAEYLAKPNTRLTVIGYSFGDAHINEAICKAADAGQLRIFIIDPAGVDVSNKTFVLQFVSPSRSSGDCRQASLVRPGAL